VKDENGVDVVNPHYLSKVFITVLPVTATQRAPDHFDRRRRGAAVSRYDI
jgi:hypothetical protein